VSRIKSVICSSFMCFAAHPRNNLLWVV
jgi:hypothetical protein